MEVFRQEETYIIGEYGLQLLLLKIIRLQLEDSIVNLEHNLFQFGKLFFNLLIQTEEIMSLNKLNFIKNIQADLTLWEAILEDTQNSRLILNFKLTIVVLFRLTVYKSQLELRGVLSPKVLVLSIGNITMHGLRFLGLVLITMEGGNLYNIWQNNTLKT